MQLYNKYFFYIQLNTQLKIEKKNYYFLSKLIDLEIPSEIASSI